MLVNQIIGILMIGLSGAGFSNGVALHLLANKTGNEKFFEKYVAIANLTCGIFSATGAVGVLILFGFL